MPIRYSLRQLEYFTAVGELGSIAQAAEQINVSAPSISASISQLEAEFGVQLFVRRHAHGLTLSPIGRELHEKAKQLLQDAAALGDAARDLAETLSGTLSIGCMLTIAPLMLPEIRRAFADRYPDVQVKQIEGDQLMLIQRLKRAEVDVCLTYDLEIPNDVDFEPLAKLPAYAMLPASHRFAKQAHVSPEELAGEPMVLLDLPASADYFLSVFSKSGLKPMIAERTRDMALLRSMVANGFGYALANIRPRTEMSPDGKPLKFVPLSGGLRALRLGVATARSPHKSRLLHAFEALCRELITTREAPGLIIEP